MGCTNTKDMAETPVNAPAASQPTAAAATVEKDTAAPASKDGAFEVHVSETFCDLYDLGTKLGSGTFSVVREAKSKKTGKVYAVKCVRRAGLSPDDISALYEEVSILRELKHPNIMQIYDFFEESIYFYLVTEKLEGGELFDRIVEKMCYTEKEARDVIRLMLDSLNFIHERNIVHRDLKPENLLLTSVSDDADIKLADFGFAKKLEAAMPNSLTTACGTPGYVAPEILEGVQYGMAVDIWSVGVISYILLCGYPPFHDDNQAQLFRKIKKGKYEFDSPYWDGVSEDAKDLIRKMLTVNPKNRGTAKELLRHPWITAGAEALEGHDLGQAMTELKKFNARRKFKAGVDAVKAINRMKAITGGLAMAAEQIKADEEAEAAESPEGDKSRTRSIDLTA